VAIAQYTDTFWFPNGTLAAGVVARVFNHSTNTLATLWQDAAGTIPQANPLTTSAAGVITFWANEGSYWLHLDTESFEITVPPSTGGPFMPLTGGTMTGPISMTGGGIDVDVQQGISAVLSTGVISGGQVAVNAGNPGLLDISAVVGYVVDYISNPLNPSVIRVSAPAQTVALADVVNTVSYWLMDSTGAIIQQNAEPTNTQRRSQILLATTAQSGGTIFEAVSIPVILPQTTNQLADLINSLGSFPISGNTISANGANLSINTTGGTLFVQSWNYGSNPADPNIKTTAAASPAQFRRGAQSTTSFGAPVSVLDVANYDNAGVLTPIGGGVNSATIQRVYAFPSNAQPDQMVILYGQAIYSSLTNALAQFATEPFVVNPTVAANGTLVALIAVIRSATDLSDTTQARFIQVGKFGGGASSASALGTDAVNVTRVVRWQNDQPLNTTVLANATHDTLTVSTAGVYTFDCYLSFDGDPASDLAMTFTAPAGSSGSWSPAAITLSNADGSGSIRLTRFAFAATSSVGAIAAGSVALPTGTLTVGGTAGELRMQVAQAVNAGTVTIRAGSWIKAYRIA